MENLGAQVSAHTPSMSDDSSDGYESDNFIPNKLPRTGHLIFIFISFFQLLEVLFQLLKYFFQHLDIMWYFFYSRSIFFYSQSIFFYSQRPKKWAGGSTLEWLRFHFFTFSLFRNPPSVFEKLKKIVSWKNALRIVSSKFHFFTSSTFVISTPISNRIILWDHNYTTIVK